MSSALTTAIAQRLNGTEVLTGTFLTIQQSLAAKLATWPPPSQLTPGQTGLPAARFGNLSDTSVFPCITFRPSAGVVDARFGTGNCVVDNPVYDVEVWGATRSAVEVTDIAALVDQLLDRRFYAPPLPLAAGSIYHSSALTTLSLIYDSKRNAWCGLTRYKFIERRV